MLPIWDEMCLSGAFRGGQGDAQAQDRACARGCPRGCGSRNCSRRGLVQVNTPGGHSTRARATTLLHWAQRSQSMVHAAFGMTCPCPLLAARPPPQLKVSHDAAPTRTLHAHRRRPRGHDPRGGQAGRQVRHIGDAPRQGRRGLERDHGHRVCLSRVGKERVCERNMQTSVLLTTPTLKTKFLLYFVAASCARLLPLADPSTPHNARVHGHRCVPLWSKRGCEVAGVKSLVGSLPGCTTWWQFFRCPHVPSPHRRGQDTPQKLCACTSIGPHRHAQAVGFAVVATHGRPGRPTAGAARRKKKTAACSCLPLARSASSTRRLPFPT